MLIVDDDPDVVACTKINLVLEGFVVHVAKDGIAGLAKAREVMPDVILLDLMMPGLDGQTVCRQLRRDPRTSRASILMLTARAMPADKVAGLTSGADDYITKPFDPLELVARLRSSMRRSKQMRDLSPLTGLPGNFDITRELEAATSAATPRFALLHVDLDDFKAFNDRYGFIRGDEAIRMTSRLLADVLAAHESEPSLLGHIGGDDFMILCGPGEAEAIACDIVESFDRVAPLLYDPEDRELGFIESSDRNGTPHRFSTMSISIGIATTASRPIRSRHLASEIAGEMKSQAKLCNGSCYELDRRTA